MTKSHVCLGLCLLMGLALAGGSTDGQDAPPGEALGGQSINESSAAFIAAFKDHDSEAIFNLLAPWVQDSVALAQARFAKRLEAGEFEGEEETMMKNYDPAGKLGFESLSEVASAHPARYFAFQTHLARLFSELESNDYSPQWYQTDRMIGLMQRRDALDGDHGIRVMPWGGRVYFETVREASVLLLYSLNGDEWVLDDVMVSVGKTELNLRESINRALSREKVWTSTEESRAVEGEQMLGTARNMALVYFAKYGNAPSKLADASMDADQRAGVYYTVRDAIYSFHSGGFKSGLVAEPNRESDPWLLLKFNCEDGQRELERFESKEKLDAKIKELQEG